MAQSTTTNREAPLGTSLLIIHLGILVPGILAWLTGDMADDYKKGEHTGLIIHQWLGMGASFFIFLRILLGIFGPTSARFSRWVPFTGKRLLLAVEDIKGLLHFRLPERPSHQGLAGVVQTFGISVFTWMVTTGIFLFLSIEPGTKARGMVHTIKEMHEAGAVLIPAFLALHAGAVFLHALRGNHLWKRVVFLDRSKKGGVEGELSYNK